MGSLVQEFGEAVTATTMNPALAHMARNFGLMFAGGVLRSKRDYPTNVSRCCRPSPGASTTRQPGYQTAFRRSEAS